MYWLYLPGPIYPLKAWKRFLDWYCHHFLKLCWMNEMKEEVWWRCLSYTIVWIFKKKGRIVLQQKYSIQSISLNKK